MSTPEGRIKAKVKSALKQLGYKCFKHMPVQNGMGEPILDFVNCIHGYYVAIETKTPGKQLTDRQKLTACQIKNAGGIVYVVRDQSDIEFMLTDLSHHFLMGGAIYDKLWDGTIAFEHHGETNDEP